MSIYNVAKAPEGTKIWFDILDPFQNGILTPEKAPASREPRSRRRALHSYGRNRIFCTGRNADVEWSQGNISTRSQPNPVSKRRRMVIISILIEHPTAGLFLFETGAGKDYPEVWGPQLDDVFARVDYAEDQELNSAIAKTGHDIKDVKGVIMGHLHLDHAGGLENFKGTQVPIYVHESELKHAYYSIATKSDLGVYLPTCLPLDLNWKTFHGDMFEVAPGLVLRHAPGHTPGLCILQVNLQNSGTWIFTTDQYHVKENFHASVPQGWLARDHDDWIRSHQMITTIHQATNASLVFGHDHETLFQYKLAPEHYD